MDLQPSSQNFFARVRVRSVLPHVGGTSRRFAGLRQARLGPPRLVRSTCGPARESRGVGIDHPASTRNLTPCYGDPKVKLCISRYNPDEGSPPYMQDYEVEPGASDHMLLDVILRLKQQDPTLTLRRSCREGVCGSDAMNINGRNGLACITRVRDLKQPVMLRPLPGFPIIRDLVVDMTGFFKQYHSVSPWLENQDQPPEKERLQSPQQRDALNGSYECILCGCCSSQCPSYWWNPDKFVGPAGLLQAYRFIVDSRDQATRERLDDLNDAYRLFRCRTIMNCSEVCPKGLEPSHAIEEIRLRMAGRRGRASALDVHPPRSPR